VKVHSKFSFPYLAKFTLTEKFPCLMAVFLEIHATHMQGEKKVHQIPAKWNAYLMRLGPLNKSKDLGFLPVERMGSDNLPLGPTSQTTPHVSGLDDIQNLSVLPPSISRFTFLYSMEDM